MPAGRPFLETQPREKVPEKLLSRPRRRFRGRNHDIDSNLKTTIDVADALSREARERIRELAEGAAPWARGGGVSAPVPGVRRRPWAHRGMDG